MKIEFKRLTEIEKSAIIDLMNNPLVRRQMPLTSDNFGEMGFETVTVLLPPTRKRVKGLLRLGFKADGELEVEGEWFVRYRLDKQIKEIVAKRS